MKFYIYLVFEERPQYPHEMEEQTNLPNYQIPISPSIISSSMEMRKSKNLEDIESLTIMRNSQDLKSVPDVSDTRQALLSELEPDIITKPLTIVTDNLHRKV
jgi:hypothetical protein